MRIQEAAPLQNLPPTQGNGIKNKWWFLVFALVILAAIALFLFMSPPKNFPEHALINIPDGATLRDISSIFYEQGLIRSKTLFVLMVKMRGDETAINSGAFIFERPSSLWHISGRVARGDHGVAKVRVTLPEGTSVKEMAAILDGALAGFDADEFIALASPREGYLFPDTYFFFTTATSGPILALLEQNFASKTASLRSQATVAPARASHAGGQKDWHELVTMASLLEEEAVTADDRRVVSGVLWNRLNIGMRLQVDAPFVYLIGKGTAELTESDLNIDSPYNTYRHDGLPPGPISNPGLDALLAALHPAETPYLYYLSDKEGRMHYARTFEEHKLNKEKYLR